MQWKRFLTAVLVASVLNVAAAADQPLTALIKQLESSKPEEQVRAAQSLGELGPRAATAVPNLVTLLLSEDLALRLEVVMALGRIGSNPQQSVPALTSALTDKTPIIQRGVVESLRTFGSDARTALPHLKSLLSSKDASVSVAAARAITSIAFDDKELVAAAIPVLIGGIAKDSKSSDEAVQGLMAAGPASIPSLQKIFAGSDSHAKVYAADALASIGPDAAPAVDQLLAAADSDNVDVSWRAIRALGAIGAKPEVVVPALTKKLQSEDSVIRTNAANTLGDFGPAAAPAVEALVKALQDKNEYVRVAAATSLGDIGPNAKAAVPALVVALDDPIGSVTITAASALGRIGKAAVPALVEKLKVPHFQQLASTVLGEMGADAADAVPTLVGLLKSKDVETRREVIIALAEIGPSAKAAVPELSKILDEKDFPARGAAAYALGRIGAKETTAALKNAVETPNDPMLRLASIWALLQFDPGNDDYAKIAVPRLAAALSSDRPRIRKEAAVTLGKLGRKAGGAVADLQKALHDDVQEIRIAAITALAEIGPESKTAVSDLIGFLNDEDPAVIRQSAAYALGRIGAGAKAAVPALHRLAVSRNSLEKTVAAWALVQIAPDSENVKLAIPVLAQALDRSPRPEVRVEAAKALGQVGTGSTPAADALKNAAKDPDESVRKAAQDALAKLK